MLLLLDISALLYFSSIGMQINVPLLVVLGLLIPVGYFYNVYDVLQAAEYIISRKDAVRQRLLLPRTDQDGIIRSGVSGESLLASCWLLPGRCSFCFTRSRLGCRQESAIMVRKPLLSC